MERKGSKVLGTAEVAAYMHKNNGGVCIKQYATTNKPIKVDAAVRTERIAHKRFELHEIEDDAVRSDVVYSKDVWSEQHDKDGKAAPGSIDCDEESCDVHGQNDNPLLAEKFREQQDQMNNQQGLIQRVLGDNTMQWMAILGIAILVVFIAVAVVW